mgnify:CR=1 FL=1
MLRFFGRLRRTGKWAVEYEQRIAALEAQGTVTADREETDVLGWCGRLDLAVKLAATATRYRHVAIVEVATGTVQVIR